VQGLAELQAAGALQAAEPGLQVGSPGEGGHPPALQAAYVSKLQQQAASIKNLLALLSSGGSVSPHGLRALSQSPSPSTPGLMQASQSSQSTVSGEGPSLYEPLWEAGAGSEGPEEVAELEDSLYENTGAVSGPSLALGE
jgi:hypothetical protein